MGLSSLPHLEPRSAWVPPELAVLPSWRNAHRVAVDLETRDRQLTELGPGVRRGAHIVGVSFAIEDGPAHYLPMRHEAGGNLPVEGVLGYLREQAGCFRGDLVGANLSYDLDFLLQAGVEFRPAWYRDVLLAEPLLDELQMGYSLDDVLGRRGLPGKDEGHLRAAAAAHGLNPKLDLYRLHSRHVGAYATRDAVAPLALLRRQERELENQELGRVWDLESRLLPVLVRTRRRGVRISHDRLGVVERELGTKEQAQLAEIGRLTGRSLTSEDLNKSEALAAVLASIGFTCPLTAGKEGRPETRKPSVTKEVLEAIDHPVAKLIRRAKQLNKIRTGYVQSMRDHAIGDRIHPTFNQLRKTDDDGDDGGARYGRLSSCDPNLQQQPARDKELGPMWRSIFLPDEGLPWASNDFSQQEIRWLVHFAAVLRCRGAEEARAAYIDNPALDYHSMSSRITGVERSKAKEILLGRCYEMGGAKLCRKLGLPITRKWSKRHQKEVEIAGPEGQAMLNQFDNGMPFVRQLSRKCEDVAKRRGYVRTALGRRCRFPRKASGEYDFTHKALNRVIQGSSGDQTKKAMVDADDAGHYVQLQVHDELDGSMPKGAADELARIMIDALPCTVPMKIDVEMGPSWGEVAK